MAGSTATPTYQKMCSAMELVAQVRLNRGRATV